MYNFFVQDDNRIENGYLVSGADLNHLKNVLRMKVGDTLLISCDGSSDLCVIDELTVDAATVRIVEKDHKNAELPIEIYLFQGLPKSDKMELIIQKCVELGVHSVIPVEMSRCVMKLEGGKKENRRARWQSIAESAAKQSKRNVIPSVGEVLSYKKMLEAASEMDVFLVPYEAKDGMVATKNALEKIKKGSKIGILIGPEGGFDEREVALAEEAGGIAVSLGARILRAETAAMTAVSMCMLYAEMCLGDE